MKKFSFHAMAVLAVMLFSQTTLLADAWYQINSSCNWFTKRYRVHVGIKKAGQIGTYCDYTNGDCSYIQRDCNYPEPDPGQPFQYVIARAYAVASASISYAEHQGGWDGSDQWLAGSDVSEQVPVYSVYPMVERVQDKKDRVSKGRLQVGSTVFDTVNRQIRLSDIQGNLTVKSFDKANDFSTFTISITMIDTLNPEDFSDAAYKKGLIWSTKAMIHNGKLLTEGRFNIKDFQTASHNQTDSIALKMKDLVIDIPSHLNMDLLTVNVGVDNGNFGLGISEKFRMSEQSSVHIISDSYSLEEQFSFSNYPNPAEGNISVTLQVPESGKVQVGIYDGNGEKLADLYEREVVAGKQASFVCDLSKFTPGTYYLKLITSDKVLVRKLIVR